MGHRHSTLTNSEEFERVFRELQEKLARSYTEKFFDPTPCLEQAYKAMNKMRKLISDIDYALSPDLKFDLSQQYQIQPRNFEGESIAQIKKIRAAMHEYRHGKND